MRGRAAALALKADSKRHLCLSQASIFAQITPYRSIRMRVFHPSQNPDVKTGEINYLKDLLLWTYSKSFRHSPSIKRKFLRFTELCVMVITFKIQSAEVIFDIEGQVYGQWVLPLIYCQLLIREFMSASLFVMNRSYCRR